MVANYGQKEENSHFLPLFERFVTISSIFFAKFAPNKSIWQNIILFANK